MENKKLKLVLDASSFTTWFLLLPIFVLFTLLISLSSHNLYSLKGLALVVLILAFCYVLNYRLVNNALLIQFKGSIIFVTYMFGKKKQFRIEDSISCEINKLAFLTKFGKVDGVYYKIQFRNGDSLIISDFDSNGKTNSVSASLRLSNNAKELVALIQENVRKNSVMD